MKLFIDIEGVLIEDLTNPVLLNSNVERIACWIERNNPISIETFSFGLWEKSDFDTWETVKKLLPFSVDTQRVTAEQLKFSFLTSILGVVSKEEVNDFNGFANKSNVFEWFVKVHQANIEEFALIDDRVETKTIITKKQKIQIINICDVRSDTDNIL